MPPRNEPDGASGPGDDARDVLIALRQQLGGRVELLSAETIYELTRVADIPPTPGVARTAGVSDRAGFLSLARRLGRVQARMETPE